MIVNQVYLVSMFGIGAMVMRGAGCTVNDLWDRPFDRHVARYYFTWPGGVYLAPVVISRIYGL